MNPDFLGDSFDIVKRFFIENIKSLGYQVFVDPMFTGEWTGLDRQFYKLVGAVPLGNFVKTGGRTALLLDPDTGIREKRSKGHITMDILVRHLQQHEIVFSFDQSFSRAGEPIVEIKRKLNTLQSLGAVGFYYDSHARFLFAAKSREALMEIEQKLLDTGLPERRFIK
jgi:hypothetical protein